MARKQGSKQQKTVSSERARFMPRKEKVWTTAYRPGAHSKSLSIPLGFAMKDLIGIAKNSKEMKFLLNNSKVIVDGKARKERNFTLGLFDVIELKESKKAYRMLLDTNGRLVAKEIPESERFKLCRIKSKKTVKGGKASISTHDGRTFVFDSTKLKPGDSVRIKLPEGKIEKELELSEGSRVLLLSGRHVGRTATVSAITPGSLRKDILLTLKQGSEEFQTVGHNVFVIGKEKQEIETFKE